MGAVTRPGRRIKCRVGVVSLTASLYNSHLPQFANPTVVNPKASSTKQMGKGGPWPGFASRTLPSKRKEGRDRARERADTNPSGRVEEESVCVCVCVCVRLTQNLDASCDRTLCSGLQLRGSLASDAGDVSVHESFSKSEGGELPAGVTCARFRALLLS